MKHRLLRVLGDMFCFALPTLLVLGLGSLGGCSSRKCYIHDTETKSIVEREPYRCYYTSSLSMSISAIQYEARRYGDDKYYIKRYDWMSDSVYEWFPELKGIEP